MQKIFCCFSAALLFLFSFTACETAEQKTVQSYQPREQVRVGCMIAEEYNAFTEQLSFMADALQEEGFQAYQSDGSTTEEVWKHICESSQQEHLIFEENCFYNMAAMNAQQMQAAFLNQEDFDLLLVFGTSAGVWLTQHAEEFSFDYMVFASADPVSAGIVKSETERYNTHSFAHVDPGRIRRQIELAYEMSKFNSVGVVYEDSDAAYSYSGIRQLEELSKLYGFNIHRRHVKEPENEQNYTRYYQELKNAYHSLLPSIDVLYITTGMIEDEKLPWLLEEVHQAGIITVAETSESQVAYGAMMHITMSDAKEEGQFAAKTLHDYMNGIPIDKLEQVFLITPHISLNQDTIEKTNTVVPMRIYLIADKVYQGEKYEK